MSTPTSPAAASTLLASLDHLNAQQLRRLLVEHLTQQKVGLYWESSAIERDAALNANVVLPRLHPEASHCPPDTTQHHNLIIEGDNFDSLRLLRATHAGKIRVIYIDPPYNTGNKDWVYNDHYVGANDRYRHSQWLEFLYQRLTLARELLTSDGVILVSINDENRARLELLMDEVFPGRRLGSLVWRTKDTGNDLTQRFSHVHEHVLVYANAGFSFNGRATDRSKFRNPDNDERGEWSPQPLTKAHSYLDRENTYYPIQDPSTGYWYPCDPNRVWAYASKEVIRRVCDGDEEAIKTAPPRAERSNTCSTSSSSALSLIQGLLQQATRPDDTVLDFFAGSGTTGHAVLALNAQDGGQRRFILCSSTEATAKEPDKNLCRDVCAERIRRVITTQGYCASFAYLQLDKIAPADVAFEFTPEQAQLLLALRETGSVPPSVGPASFHPIGLQGDWLLVLCHNTSAATLDALAQLPAQYGAARLAVFCQRPKGVPAQLQARGVPQAVAYSLVDALLKGQAASPRKTRTATPKASAAEAV